jgi:MFS family permease
MLLLGVGLGVAWPSLMSLAMSGATEKDSGLASGLINTAQQIGGALGLALLATLAATRSNSLLAAGASRPQALTDGYHLAFIIAAAMIASGIPIAAIVIRSHAKTHHARVEPVHRDDSPVAADVGHR